MPYAGRRVPVIADERVDPGFGTGALKVTPGHDPLDFEIGRDHGLPEPSCIGPDGRVTAVGLDWVLMTERQLQAVDEDIKWAARQ